MAYHICVEHNFIRFPIQAHGSEREVHIFLNKKEIYRFTAALFVGNKETDTCDFYAELPVQHLKGQQIELVLDPEEGESEIWAGLQQADELLTREKNNYPFLHFAAGSGWLNDPNGLCFYQGEYHLFFQHNMFGLEWDNISWGHAVSRDLLHWEQVEEALMPDEYGPIFSGCAITNGGPGRPCMPDCPEGALLLFYTSAGNRTKWSEGRCFTQKAAYSLDGRAFTKIEEPLIGHIVFENRDPKVYWNEQASSYYLVLFLDEHDYSIFVSKDMKNWEMTQKLTIEESWECPDLLQIPVYGKEEQKWVFWTPDGYYLVGEFDGRKFIPGQEIKKIYGNEQRTGYAAQTFWGIPDRAVQIPWLIRFEKEQLYKGLMGLPRELVLLEQDGSYVLAGHVVREVYGQEERMWETVPHNGSGRECIREESFAWSQEGAVLLQLENPENNSFELEFCGACIKWSREERALWIGNLNSVFCEGIEDMTLVADRGVLEVGCNKDTTLYYTKLEQEFLKNVRIKGVVNVSLGVIR